MSPLPTLSCPACGEPVRPDGFIDGGRWTSANCGGCGSLSFHTGKDEGDDDRYERLYDDAADDAQFQAAQARARLRLLGAVRGRLAPPPRLRTSDRYVADLLGRGRGKVVDWGCGGGRLAFALARRGWDVLGVEVSHELVGALNAAGLTARHADDLPAGPDRDCRAVLLCEVLEHLEDPLGLLRELAGRYPNARFVATVPSPLRANAVAGLVEAWDLPPNHLIRFTPEGLTALFERAGLRARVVEPAPSGLDAVPAWWRSLAAGAAGRVTTGSSAPGRHRRQSRLAAFGLLWAHWAHDRAGGLLGLPEARRQEVEGLAAGSMVAIAGR
jgi:SAM-dependent methyltransferase